jgi:hypothetical protein
LALRGRSSDPLTALRTSWSVSTLQEQMIMKREGPFGSSVCRSVIFDIEEHGRMQKEKLRFEAIPNCHSRTLERL